MKKKYIKSPTEENEQRRNQAKSILRKAHQEGWAIFISSIENDTHGVQ